MLFFPLVTALVLFKFVQLGLNRVLAETGVVMTPPAPAIAPSK